MKTLYVGFKGIHNSSNKLVRNLQGEKYFLTNSFEGLKRDIENLVGEYEQVYMFGLDKALKDSVRIEKCAEKDGERIYTQMLLSGIEECLKNMQSHTVYRTIRRIIYVMKPTFIC